MFGPDSDDSTDALTGAAAADAGAGKTSKLVLGVILVFLVSVLGIGLYFAARKKVLERRIENYLG